MGLFYEEVVKLTKDKNIARGAGKYASSADSLKGVDEPLLGDPLRNRPALFFLVFCRFLDSAHEHLLMHGRIYGMTHNRYSISNRIDAAASVQWKPALTFPQSSDFRKYYNYL